MRKARSTSLTNAIRELFRGRPKGAELSDWDVENLLVIVRIGNLVMRNKAEVAGYANVETVFTACDTIFLTEPYFCSFIGGSDLHNEIDNVRRLTAEVRY